MTQLTPHFSDAELGVEYAEGFVRANALYHCEMVLEPIREQFKTPLHVHDGFRDPKHNEAVGGVANSEHEARGGHFATDFDLGPDVPLTHAFNWIRLFSGLPYRQVILEYQGEQPGCIHISTDKNGPDKHEALVRHTVEGKWVYQKVECGPVRIPLVDREI